MANVSVIIPTYRRARLLGEALKSVLEQSFTDFEVIIVDDHSEDDGATLKVVKAFGEARFKYVYLHANRGPAGARNAALPHCHGEFLSFLDSDDLFRPCKLESHAALLRANPHVAMVYSDEYVVTNDGHLSAGAVRGNRILPSGFIAKEFFMESFIATMTVTLRRAVFAEMGGFDETLAWNEDDDLWFRIMMKYPVICSEYVSGIRRLHDSNMSRDRDRMVWHQLRCIANYINVYADFMHVNHDLAVGRLKSILRSYLLGKLGSRRLPSPTLLAFYLRTTRQLHGMKRKERLPA